MQSGLQPRAWAVVDSGLRDHSCSCLALGDLWAGGLTWAGGPPAWGEQGRCCPSPGALGSLVRGHQGSFSAPGLVNWAVKQKGRGGGLDCLPKNQGGTRWNGLILPSCSCCT